MSAPPVAANNSGTARPTVIRRQLPRSLLLSATRAARTSAGGVGVVAAARTGPPGAASAGGVAGADPADDAVVPVPSEGVERYAGHSADHDPPTEQ